MLHRGLLFAVCAAALAAAPAAAQDTTTAVRPGMTEADVLSRWGEPVAKGVQRVVTENLAALLPTRRVVAAPFSPNQVVHQRVDITLSEAARQADGSVLVEARWAVLGPKGATLVQHRTSHRANPTAAGAAGAVTGASDALGALSRDIADALRALPPPPPEETPTDKK